MTQGTFGHGFYSFPQNINLTMRNVGAWSRKYDNNDDDTTTTANNNNNKYNIWKW